MFCRPHLLPVARKSERRKNSNPRISFGLVLRELRLKLGYSQEYFAHIAGYHRNYVSQLERGEKSPSLTAVFNLANACEMKASELIELVESKISKPAKQ